MVALLAGLALGAISVRHHPSFAVVVVGGGVHGRHPGNQLRLDLTIIGGKRGRRKEGRAVNFSLILHTYDSVASVCRLGVVQ